MDLDPDRIAEFNRRILRTHSIACGPIAGHEVARATMTILLNAMASGYLGVRPQLARVLADALNADRKVEIHLLGSMGQSDMAAMSDLAIELYGDMELAPGEGLALVNSSAFGTALATIAVSDMCALLDTFTLVSAVSMEAYAANPSIVTDAALGSRPFRGVKIHGDRIRAYLSESYLWTPSGPRNLQDPLAFRSIPLIHGCAGDALEYATSQLKVELNAAQCNPIVSEQRQALFSTANFDMVALAMLLDVARLALSPTVTSSTERLAKMADSFWSELPQGLIRDDGVGATGFNGIAQFHKSITSEARLLTVPLVGEFSSSSHSNGNMDRMNMAALGARRASELVRLGELIVAMELLTATQAVDMRGASPLGRTTREVYKLVRDRVPFAAAGDPPPRVDPLLCLVREGLAHLIAIDE
jgi:histidine ammonia-lyase